MNWLSNPSAAVHPASRHRTALGGTAALHRNPDAIAALHLQERAILRIPADELRTVLCPQHSMDDRSPEGARLRHPGTA